MRPKSCEGLEQAVASRVGFVVRRHGGRSRRFVCENGGVALRGLGGLM